MSTVEAAERPPLNATWQGFVGVSLAIAIILAWLATHIAGVFLFNFAVDPPVLVPILVALQCWLNVGLFIVAHDAMHGSLAPFRPRVNRAFGRVCLALYAGFSFDRLITKHFDHHRHSGTELDPDFHATGPDAFWPWFFAFFRRYFGWRELATLSTLVAVYLFVFRISTENTLVFWALPAILSAVQLFYFGTYLPHRHEDEAGFSDRHNARSNDFSWTVSLLTCFHFGYHHEHHDNPRVPWWHLPRMRAGR
jgi:beta-carotene ketolase (CrtW type)